MLFSSPTFIFVFLPLVLGGYLLAGRNGRNYFLLFASIFFYAWGGVIGGVGSYVLLLIFCIVANYCFGILIDRYRESSYSRIIIWLTLSVNLGMLLWYKYYSFISATFYNLLFQGASPAISSQPQAIPLGISFFTFQAMAYLLDVYRDEAKPQMSLTSFALFMALFPKIIAGPIIRYGEVADDLCERRLQLDQFALGAKRFIIGLGKKVLIADTLAPVADRIFAAPPHGLTTGVAWLGLVCYTLQIYFDFSGYSDMAIGLCRIFGFKIRENFNYPYISRSLTEFWRRWHISLSTWFRDYLFIPLTYSLMTDRVRQKIAQGKYRTNYRILFSIFTVFILCGLWHGAGWNYIIWGGLHGAVLALESLCLARVIKRWWAPFQHGYLLLIVMLAWVFFRIPFFMDAVAYLKALSGFSHGPAAMYDLSMYINIELVLALVAGTLASMPIKKAIADFMERRGFYRLAATCEVSCLILIMILAFIYMANSTFSPFLYRKF